MRWLLWFSLGFALACVLGVYLISGSWLLLLGLFALVATIAVLSIKTPAGKISFGILLGLTVGLVWVWGFDLLTLSHARAYDGKTVNGSTTITQYSTPTESGLKTQGLLLVDGKEYKVQLYLRDHDTLCPGDFVEGNFYLRYTADGGEKGPTYHQGKGIFLLAYAGNNARVETGTNNADSYFIANLRQQIFALLDKLFPEDTLGFARALLMGDRSRLSDSAERSFSYSGIAHIIAVSGMHVSILFSVVYVLCAKHRVATAVIGLPILVLFAALAGFTPSIARACIMQALMILALLLNREYDPPTALAFAVLCMLAVNPLTITAVSFQLSVGCMVGIFLFSSKIHGYFMDPKRLGPAKGKSLKSRLIRFLVGSVSVTLSAMIATTPLCAYYFECVSVVGPITNILTLWVVSFIFCGIIVSLLLGLIFMPLGVAAAYVVSVPMRYVMTVASLLARVPAGVVFVNNPYIIAWLVFVYVLLGVFFLCRRKHPLILTVCILLSLVISIGLSWLEPRLDNYRVTVLDVGQGQCVLLQYDDRYYMVDCGGDSDQIAADTALKQLLSQGIFRLDGLILTHYDADHAGGAAQLLSHISADTIYLPDVDRDNAYRMELEDKYKNRIQWLDAGDVHRENDFPITIFAALEEAEGNESSLCILFQPDNCDILITGDRDSGGERDLMNQTALPELELLVVGHHGSASSSCLEFLYATSPEVAVISVGEDNSYGHPKSETLERLRLVGSEILRTDLEGTLIFRG